MYGLKGICPSRGCLEIRLTQHQPKAAPAAAAPKAATPSTPSASTSTPAPPPAPQPNPASTVTAPPASPSPAGQTAAAPAPAVQTSRSFNDPSALLVGQQGESVVGQMEAMGFPRSEIDRAMRAAFFNPDRAIEYLLNGIPENVQGEQRQATASGAARGGAATSPGAAPAHIITSPPPPSAATGDEPINLFEAAAQAGGRPRSAGARTGAAAAGVGAGAAAGGQPPVNMDFLRNSPHFQQLRQLVQQQPAMLEPILQQVAEGNPQLAQMIGQNQEQFLQLLSEVCSDLNE